MTSFVNYLLESGISLSLFALGYFLFLRRETFFSVNRWFLLVTIGFSAFLPLLHIPFYTPEATVLPEVTVTPYVNLLSSVTIYGTALSRGAEQFVLNYSLLGYVYVLGVVVFAGLFIFRIYHIIRLIAQNQVVPEGKIKLVFLDRELSPFSFLNYIFVSRNLQNTKGWEKMLEHEKQHIQQGHTFDVLVLEFVAVFQWFNPFFWMFRRALRENHEFLADQAVISHGTAPSWYKQILLNQYVGEQIVLANNFNYSLIKTRIQMISKIKSRKIANVKFLVGIVLAVSLIAVFACEQKDSVKTEVAAGGKTVTLVADGHSLQINGDSAGIEKLKSIIAESGDYELNVDGVTGEMKLTGKNNKVGEIVAIAYGKEEKAAQEEVFFIVDEMPEFPEGQPALRKFIAQTIKYPVKAQENGIQGKVFVTFVVAKDGTVKNAKVVRGVDPSLDQEALRVVNSLPKWKPGKQEGKEVAVSYTVPINFVLQ
ncbi:MAG: M56 family metallopeptidase [Prolixibacteraceae bacterium]|nr:M56 family metallopeptidase [Prolixibacteraceae bacterium]